MENNGNGSPTNRAGWYRHPESGAVLHVTDHPKLGSPMADGVVAQGYQWVGDTMPESQSKAETGDEAKLRAENEELRARLAALESKEDDPTLNELRAKAKELGLKADGTKEKLKTRIADAEKETK